MRKLMLLATALLISAFSATAQQTNDDSGYPTIQDTFFGMKMGSLQNCSTIKQALYGKGEFLRQNHTSSGEVCVFKEVIFAGRTWDFCELCLSDRKELYDIVVYDSLHDFGYDEKKEAEKLYETYKNKLTVKYGIREEEKEEDEQSVFYLGENSMCVLLYSRRSKSEGGSYRRFVGIDYTQTEIYRRLLAVNDDEL